MRCVARIFKNSEKIEIICEDIEKFIKKVDKKILEIRRADKHGSEEKSKEDR